MTFPADLPAITSKSDVFPEPENVLHQTVMFYICYSYGLYFTSEEILCMLTALGVTQVA